MPRAAAQTLSTTSGVLAILLLVPALSAAAVSVGVPRAEPSAIAVTTATPVLFTTTITGGTPLLGGVNLIRVEAAAQTVVAKMHDDGQDGDGLAGDGVFSALLTLNEARGPVTFRVSAAFKGQLLRTLSPLAQLAVNSQTSESSRTSIAQALANRDTATAYLGFGERLNELRFLDTLPGSAVDALVQGLRSCSPTTTTDRYELCVASFTDVTGEPRSYQFVSVRDLFGVWRIIVW